MITNVAESNTLVEKQGGLSVFPLIYVLGRSHAKFFLKTFT